jgi:hypothetical protein
MNTYLNNHISVLQEAMKIEPAAARVLLGDIERLENPKGLINSEITLLRAAAGVKRGLVQWALGSTPDIDPPKLKASISAHLPEAEQNNTALVDTLYDFLRSIVEKRSSGKEISREEIDARLDGLEKIIKPKSLESFMQEICADTPCSLIRFEIELLTTKTVFQNMRADMGLTGYLNSQEKFILRHMPESEKAKLNSSMSFGDEEQGLILTIKQKALAIQKKGITPDAAAFFRLYGNEIQHKDEIYNRIVDIAKMISKEVSQPSSHSFDDIHKAFFELEALLDPPSHGDSRLEDLIDALDENTSLSILKDYTDLCVKQQLETRFIQNGLLLGKMDAYINTGHQGKDFTLKNPVTRELELFDVRPINCKKQGADGEYQEQSLLGNIFIAKNKNEIYPVMHIEWRGSQTQESWLSDAQRGPGFDSFFAHEDEILSQITDAVKVANKKAGGERIHVIISGHSLGGALAQTTLNSIQRAICRSMGEDGKRLNTNYDAAVEADIIKSKYATSKLITEHQSSINKVVIPHDAVASIHAVTFNSAGVLQPVGDSSNDCSRFLKEQAGISSHLHAHQNNRDVVQATGQATILTRISNNQADVELFFNTHYEGAINTRVVLGTHRVHTYTSQGTYTSPTKGIEHTIYHPEHEAALTDHLEYKYPLLQKLGDLARQGLALIGKNDVLGNYKHLRAKYTSPSPATVTAVAEVAALPTNETLRRSPPQQPTVPEGIRAQRPESDGESPSNGGGGGMKP